MSGNGWLWVMMAMNAAAMAYNVAEAVLAMRRRKARQQELLQTQVEREALLEAFTAQGWTVDFDWEDAQTLRMKVEQGRAGPLAPGDGMRVAKVVH